MRLLEQKGDRIAHDIRDVVAGRLVLPLDREDARSLASAVDNVVDFIDEATEHLVIYHVAEVREDALALVRVVREATRQLAAELQRFAGRQRGEDSHHAAVVRAERDGDRLVRHAISRLFEQQPGPA